VVKQGIFDMNKKLKFVTIGEIMLGLRAPMESTLEGAPYLV
jgi:hypothetical protein